MSTTTLGKSVGRRLGEVTPSLEELRLWRRTASAGERTAPIYREIMADSDTPVSAFLKIQNGTPAFLLESIEGGERIARYSFIGTGPIIDLTLKNGEATIHRAEETERISYDDPLRVLEELLGPLHSGTVPGTALPRFVGGAVGYLSYEAVRSFEPRVGRARGDGLALPDGRFLVVDTLLVFDNIERTIKVVSHVYLDEPSLEAAYAEAETRIADMLVRLRQPAPPTPRGGPPLTTAPEDRRIANTQKDVYLANVDRAREYIIEGDIFQVVLSQRVDLPTPAHPFTIYRALRAVNPSPYMFYLNFIDHQIVGASPELLVRLEDGVVTNHPIAGTRPRGSDAVQDGELAQELLADEKECAEHVMLVDLGRNDVGRVSIPGTVRVPRFMGIDKYSHVMHIVSHVEGDIRPELSAFDALRACFPAGTVSGAPKVRAMEIIAEMETDVRGPYAGAVGYVDFSGGMDTCIALRTLVVKDGVASMQAGGGIVFDSSPEGEFMESHHKMRALLRAIELAEDIETEEQSANAGRLT